MNIKRVYEMSETKMKPTLKKEETPYYVSTADIIEFINENSDMDWNYICKFIRKNNITNDYGPSSWEKSDILNSPNDYNPEAVKWIGGFFEAHPWAEIIMIVFDD